MIGRLRGILLEKEVPYLLIDVSGVAYEVQASMTTFTHLPDVGNQTLLHTHLVIREDAHQLYGFYDREERELFRHLIKVNGVGPKIALAILSSITPEVFIGCVLDNDAASLVRLPGIGNKMAERLIIEMRDKLTHWKSSRELGRGEAFTSGVSREISAVNDAVRALISLGYKPHDATRAVSKVNDEKMKTEDLIKLALNYLVAA